MLRSEKKFKNQQGGSLAFDSVENHFNTECTNCANDMNFTNEFPQQPSNDITTTNLQSNYLNGGKGKRTPKKQNQLIKHSVRKGNEKVEAPKNHTRRKSQTKRQLKSQRKRQLNHKSKMLKTESKTKTIGGNSGNDNIAFTTLNPQTWDTNYVDNTRPSTMGDSTAVGASIPTNAIQNFNKLLNEGILKDATSHPMNYSSSQLYYNNGNQNVVGNDLQIPAFVASNTKVNSILNPHQNINATVVPKQFSSVNGLKLSDLSTPYMIGGKRKINKNKSITNKQKNAKRKTRKHENK